MEAADASVMVWERRIRVRICLDDDVIDECRLVAFYVVGTILYFYAHTIVNSYA